VSIRELSHVLRDALREVRKSVRRSLRVDRAIAAVLRWPVVILIGAIRHAPTRSRMRILRHGIRSLAAASRRKAVELCEISSLAEFESGYAHLAEILGHAGKTPAPGEVEFLASITKRRKYYPGAIAPDDHLFLTAFVSVLAPRRVVEIGTLGGFSAGIIAATLARRHRTAGASWVDTIDIHAQCAADRTRPTGFEIAELFPEFVSMIRLHTPADSSVVSQLAGRDELELAFIDADHRHPLPLLDLLRLAPCVRGDGWILLHDIQWGTIGRKAAEAGQTLHWGSSYGAEWLFDRWPFQKISGGNIGAVQLPEQKSALIPLTLRLMSTQFEISDKHARSARGALYQGLGGLL
jgi:predicted O-methyltransferase YrrM